MVRAQTSPMADRDFELIRRLAEGDASAYLLIRPEIQRVFEQVWHRLRPRYPDLDADRHDLAQSLEMHLVRNDYRVLTTFRGESRFSTWLHAVAMRHVRREAERLVRRRRTEGAQLDPNRPDQDTDLEQDALRRAERARVRKVVGDLGDDDRNLIGLFFEQGLNASAVARVLGSSPGGVRMRKKRLLSKLQAKLLEHAK